SSRDWWTRRLLKSEAWQVVEERRFAAQGAMGTRETRTQGALVAALRARPRTPYRAVQCVLKVRRHFLAAF
ncbi:MAG: hypothetical protein ACYC8U_11305, partial [Thermoleophilia bacterium]